MATFEAIDKAGLLSKANTIAVLTRLAPVQS